MIKQQKILLTQNSKTMKNTILNPTVILDDETMDNELYFQMISDDNLLEQEENIFLQQIEEEYRE